MNSTEFSKAFTIAAVVMICLFIMVALTGCQQQPKFTLERVPEEYRSCAAKVMPQLPNRAITTKELVLAYAELKKYAGTKDKCLKGLIKWADAQHSAYYQHFR